MYLYCAFLGSWGLYPGQKFPYHAEQVNGLACLPVEADAQSSVFFWLVMLPLFNGIPTVYVGWVTFDIWRRKLLPPSGKRRLLAIYFGRIVLVFLLMWVPFFLLSFVLLSWMPTVVLFIGGTLSHLQGPASAAVSLLKPDIWLAVKRFFKCQCCQPQPQDELDSTFPSSSNSSSLVILKNTMGLRQSLENCQ